MFSDLDDEPKQKINQKPYSYHIYTKQIIILMILLCDKLTYDSPFFIFCQVSSINYF